MESAQMPWTDVVIAISAVLSLFVSVIAVFKANKNEKRIIRIEKSPILFLNQGGTGGSHGGAGGGGAGSLWGTGGAGGSAGSRGGSGGGGGGAGFGPGGKGGDGE